VTVRWYDDGREQECRFGFEGTFDVRLLPGAWQVELDAGTRCMRSRDWAWGMQDGGAGGLGTVEGPALAANWYRVRWDTGACNIYRYSVLGKQDIEVHVLNSLSAIARDDAPGNASLPARGCLVERAPDWSFGVQDGNSRGTVLGESSKPGWVRVRWNRTGYQNDYRLCDVRVVAAAFDGSEKLCFAPAPPPAAAAAAATAAAATHLDDGTHELCIACCANAKAVTMLPCSHIAYCKECISRVCAPICPFCRAPVTEFASST